MVFVILMWYLLFHRTHEDRTLAEYYRNFDLTCGTELFEMLQRDHALTQGDLYLLGASVEVGRTAY